MANVDLLEWTVLLLGTLVSVWGSALAARTVRNACTRPKFPPAWYLAELVSVGTFIFLVLGDMPILLAALPIALGTGAMMFGMFGRRAA